jgi:hypothetical protein
MYSIDIQVEYCTFLHIFILRGHFDRDNIVVRFTTTCAFLPITTNVVHGEVYSIQHYVIKFVSNLRHVAGFLHQYN